MFMIVSLTTAAISMAASAKPPFGGGFGFGKGKGQDYFGLVQNPQVKAELKITDAQMDKLPAVALKALAEVLDAKQLARLKQMYLQTRGNGVYLEADIKAALKITDAQATKIKTAMDDQAKAQQEMLQSGDFDFEKMQELQKTTKDKVQGTLTEAQKTKWTKMIGEPFEMKGFGGKGFGKKKDN